MKTRNILFTVLVSAVTTLGVLFAYNKYNHNSNNPNFQTTVPANYKYAGFLDSGNSPSGSPVDFTQAAAAAIPAVVHIKTTTDAKMVNNNLPQQQNPFSDLFGNDLFNQLFGQGGRQRMLPEKASGSGVIISDDGYIVTNNHVVAGADKVTVITSDRKTYTAKVIAADPAYDLAVIKIDATNLPFLLYGNSQILK